MARVITLQRPAVCTSCGVTIPAGVKARYYGADVIYCETHQKDAAGHDIPNTGTIPQLPAQKPFVAPASEPQPMSAAISGYDELREEISLLTQAVHWQTEKVALATDFLNTLCILLRQNQEARNDKAKQDNGPAKAAPARASQKPGK